MFRGLLTLLWIVFSCKITCRLQHLQSQDGVLLLQEPQVSTLNATLSSIFFLHQPIVQTTSHQSGKGICPDEKTHPIWEQEGLSPELVKVPRNLKSPHHVTQMR